MQYLAFIFSIKKMAHDTNKTYERPEVFQLMQPIHKTNNTKPLLHKENNNSMIGCFRFNIWIFLFSLYRIPKCFSLVNGPTWHNLPSEYFDMMTSSSQIIKNVRFVSEEMVHIDWLCLDDFVEVSGRTNVVIAAYTTAQARLKLYGYLERLNTRTLYCDTECNLFL